MEKNKLSGYDFKNLHPYKKILSSSQVICYEEDPSKFYLEYMLGAKRKASKSMLVGSIFSELHNHRDFDFRAKLIEIKAIRRIGDLFDEVIKAFPIVPAEIPLKCKYKGWGLRATLDGFVEDSYTIIENKTGQVPWTQERANFSDQITFQAFVHWKKYGIQPRQIILNWVDTKFNTQKKLSTFKTSRTIKGLKMFEKRLDAVIQGIEAENFTNQLYF